MKNLTVFLFLICGATLLSAQTVVSKIDEVRYYRDFNLSRLEFLDELDSVPTAGPYFIKLMKDGEFAQVVAHFPESVQTAKNFDEWIKPNIVLHKKRMGLTDYIDLKYYMQDSVVTITLMKDHNIWFPQWRLYIFSIETSIKCEKIQFKDFSYMPKVPKRWVEKAPMEFLTMEVDSAQRMYTLTQTYVEDFGDYLQVQTQRRDYASKPEKGWLLDDSLYSEKVCIQKDSAWWKPHYIYWEYWNEGIFPRCGEE